MYGFEADKHLFRCLVASVDFTADGRNSGKDGQQLQLLIQEANLLMTKPNLVSILCYAFEKQDSKVQCCRGVFEVNLAPPLSGPGHFPWYYGPLP